MLVLVIEVFLFDLYVCRSTSRMALLNIAFVGLTVAVVLHLPMATVVLHAVSEEGFIVISFSAVHCARIIAEERRVARPPVQGGWVPQAQDDSPSAVNSISSPHG
ncbi:MAG: hypothetical protein R3C19_27035 [Planctomycetaceae bacterium]